MDEARGLPTTSPWVLQQGRPPFRLDSSRTPTGDLLGVPELRQESASPEHGLQTISEENEGGVDVSKQEEPEAAPKSPRKSTQLAHYVPEVFLMEYGSMYASLGRNV